MIVHDYFYLFKFDITYSFTNWIEPYYQTHSQYSKHLEDELLAERLQELERKEEEMYRKQQHELVEADSKLAAETENQMMKEVQDEKESLQEADFKCARKVQQSFNREYHEEMISSVKKDAEVAKKISRPLSYCAIACSVT